MGGARVVVCGDRAGAQSQPDAGHAVVLQLAAAPKSTRWETRCRSSARCASDNQQRTALASSLAPRVTARRLRRLPAVRLGARRRCAATLPTGWDAARGLSTCAAAAAAARSQPGRQGKPHVWKWEEAGSGVPPLPPPPAAACHSCPNGLQHLRSAIHEFLLRWVAPQGRASRWAGLWGSRLVGFAPRAPVSLCDAFYASLADCRAARRAQRRPSRLHCNFGSARAPGASPAAF